MRFRSYWRWFIIATTFQNVVSETSTEKVGKTSNALVDKNSDIKISPRGERRIRVRKKPTLESSDVAASTPSDVSSDVSNDFTNDDRLGSSTFLQVLPFRLSDGTPMLRWRPVDSTSTTDRATWKSEDNFFSGTFVITETPIDRELTADDVTSDGFGRQDFLYRLPY